MIINDAYQKILTQCKKANAQLLVVSKTQPLGKIEELYHQGQRDFAENRIPDLIERAHYFKEKKFEMRWHLIGPIQSNKFNKLSLIPGLLAIHSIGSLEQWRMFYEKWQGDSLDLYLQVNTSGEIEKSGFKNKEDLSFALDWIKEHPHQKLKLRGLMTMASIRAQDQEKAAHTSFKALKELKESLFPTAHLSMGMSQDYETAFSYGTGIIRVGSKIFTP
jgi:pyridoxal phosphate enzyme (YggS family)